MCVGQIAVITVLEVMLWIKEIWRYPVKTMAGEQLQKAHIGELGIEGDRIIHVENANGRIITSRTHPRFLGLNGSLAEDGNPLVDGMLWNSERVGSLVAQIGGEGAKLVKYEGAERFDVLPLLVATDGAVAEFGYDVRRLRPNLVIGGVEGMAERDWPGASLHVGETVIGIQDLRLRCIMTSFDPETIVQDAKITQSIYNRFEGKLALNCFVIQGGEIAVGDQVLLKYDKA